MAGDAKMNTNNPLRMIGPYLGAIAGFLTMPFWESPSLSIGWSKLINPQWWSMKFTPQYMNTASWGVLIVMVVLGFLVGWGLQHIYMRYIR